MTLPIPIDDLVDLEKRLEQFNSTFNKASNLAKQVKFKKGEPVFNVADRCYSIISDIYLDTLNNVVTYSVVDNVNIRATKQASELAPINETTKVLYGL